MPDRGLPQWARRTLRVLRVVLYALLALAGLAAIIWSPVTIASSAGLALTRTLGAVALAASLVCLVSQLLYRWIWEWLAVWWIGAAIGLYAMTVWALAVDNSGRTLQAALVSAASVMLLIRGVDLGAFASTHPGTRRRARPGGRR
jgi:hypothetical protein